MKRLAAVLLLVLPGIGSAQLPPPSHGEPLDTYIGARADYAFGALGYCSPPGQARLFERLNRRWARVRSILVDRLGEDAVHRADIEARARFDEEIGSVDFIGCRLNDPSADRRNYREMRARHTSRLVEVERLLQQNSGD